MRQLSPSLAVDVAPKRSGEAALSYEFRLGLDSRWALSEGSKFFEEKSAVQDTLRTIAARLRQLGIDYAAAGGMAVFFHGFRRFTEDVDLLVTRRALLEIHRQLEGLGYLPVFTGSKNLRDTQTGVKIEFLVTGDFPGDGKPKAVSFPDPAAVTLEHDGVRYVNLPTLIELKLASGMTSAERLKDLADVQELIKILNLPNDFARRLNPFVQEKFREIWQTARPVRTFVRLWKKTAPASGDNLTLESMLADGVTIVSEKDDVLRLATSDPAIAEKYDMHDASEFLPGT